MVIIFIDVNIINLKLQIKIIKLIKLYFSTTEAPPRGRPKRMVISDDAEEDGGGGEKCISSVVKKMNNNSDDDAFDSKPGRYNEIFLYRISYMKCDLFK